MADVRNVLLDTPEGVPIRGGDIDLPVTRSIDITYLTGVSPHSAVLSASAKMGSLDRALSLGPDLAATPPQVTQRWYSTGGRAATPFS